MNKNTEEVLKRNSVDLSVKPRKNVTGGGDESWRRSSTPDSVMSKSEFLRQCSLSTISSASSSISWAEDAMESEFTNKLAKMWNQIEEVCGGDGGGRWGTPAKPPEMSSTVYDECLLWRRAFPDSPLIRFNINFKPAESRTRARHIRPNNLNLSGQEESKPDKFFLPFPPTPTYFPSPKTPEVEDEDLDYQGECLTPNPITSTEYDVSAWLNECKVKENEELEDQEDDVFGEGPYFRHEVTEVTSRVRQLSLPFLVPTQSLKKHEKNLQSEVKDLERASLSRNRLYVPNCFSTNNKSGGAKGDGASRRPSAGWSRHYTPPDSPFSLPPSVSGPPQQPMTIPMTTRVENRPVSYFEKLRSGQNNEVRAHFIGGREKTDTGSVRRRSDVLTDIERPKAAHLPSILQDLGAPSPTKGQKRGTGRRKSSTSARDKSPLKSTTINVQFSPQQWFQGGIDEHPGQVDQVPPIGTSKEEKAPLTPFLFWLLDKVAI